MRKDAVMTTLFKHITALCMAALLCLTAGCDKNDDTGLNENGTTTVKLVFNARNEGLTEGFEANEGMKTLRVIMVDGSGLVDYNKCETLDKDYTSYTVTIEDVPVGIKHFYVIANEASIGLGESNFSKFAAGSTVTDADRTALKEMVIANGQGQRYFPRTASAIANNGLPITGYMENQIISGTESQSIVIPITHAVVKMNISVQNETSKTCRLNSVTFGAFHPRQTFLFDEEGYEKDPANVVLPGNTLLFPVTYDTAAAWIKQSLDANMTAGERVFTYYLFEPKASSQDFTISFGSDTHANLATKKVFLPGEAQLLRNTEVTLNVIIKDSGITFAGITVDGWDYTYSGGDVNID